jgi:hypothetical protein
LKDMKRTVNFELGTKNYKFETGDQQNQVDEILNEIKMNFASHSQEVEKYGNEHFFLMMLLNVIEENLELKKQLAALTEKIEKQGKRIGS